MRRSSDTTTTEPTPNRRRRRRAGSASSSRFDPHSSRSISLASSKDDEDDIDEKKSSKQRSSSCGSSLYNYCNEIIAKQYQKFQKHKRLFISLWVAKKLVLITVLILITPVPKLLSLAYHARHKWEAVLSHLERPVTDDVVNEIAIVFPSLADRRTHDVGGWKHSSGIRLPKSVPITDEDGRASDWDPQTFDSGRLFVRRIGAGSHNHSSHSHGVTVRHHHHNASREDGVLLGLGPPRVIAPDDALREQNHWESLWGGKSPRVKSFDRHEADLEAEADYPHTQPGCYPPNWIKRYHPNCNELHETATLAKPTHPETQQASFRYVSHGSHRDVWLLEHPDAHHPIHATTPAQTALKVFRYSWKNHDHDVYMRTLHDATVMDQLQASPNIVDVFGHCGISVWVEAMPFDVKESVIGDGGSGRISQKDLHDEDDVKPRNKYTAPEKLMTALEMAESLADLHGFRDGAIAHDDVQMTQWLRNKDGKLKLGDFSRAKFLTYHVKNQTYCTYDYDYRKWRYRAPEEYAGDWLNEQIDVFSFGNNIYGLLTGNWPFYHIDDDEIIRHAVRDGNRTFVDPRYKTKGYIEEKLIDLMNLCWEQDPDKRITIFKAVRLLRGIRKEAQTRGIL